MRKAAAAARAEGRVPKANNRTRQVRRRCCGTRWWPSMGKWPVAFVFGLCGAMVGEPTILKEIARGIGAVNNVAEGAGAAAQAAGFAVANATVGVTTSAREVMTSSLSLAKEAWLGIDLLNVTANRSHGRVVATSFKQIEAWADENPNFVLDTRTVLWPIRTVGPELPFAQWADSSTDVARGRHLAWQVWARHLPPNYVAISFVALSVSFSPRWSNPVWEMFELDPRASSEQVLTVLSGITESLPSFPPEEISLTDDFLLVQKIPEPVVESEKKVPTLSRTIFFVVTLVASLALGLWTWHSYGQAEEMPAALVVAENAAASGHRTPHGSNQSSPVRANSPRVSIGSENAASAGTASETSFVVVSPSAG